MSKEKVEVKPGKETALATREPFFPTLFAAPFPFMRRFVEDVERMFDEFGPSFAMAPWKPGEEGFRVWAPDVEIKQTNGEFMVKVDLPGLTKKDVKVEVSDGALTIEGERKQEKEEKGEGFYRSERTYGKFSRTIALPEGVEVEKAKANFTNGVLEIVMPAPTRKAPPTRVLEIAEPAEKVEKPKAAA
jgi:HSP20 family protein